MPTVLQFLTNSDPAHEEVISHCFGCCCCHPDTDVDPVKLLSRFECGHRIDLRDDRAREALAGMLRGEAPPEADGGGASPATATRRGRAELTGDQRLVRKGMKSAAKEGK